MSALRILTDRELARFIANLGQERIEVVYPEDVPGVGDRFASYRVYQPELFAGGVRAASAIHDIKLIIEDLESLRAQMAERNDGPKVRVDGGKVNVGRDGVVTINGGKVTITGPARLVEVRA